MRRRTKRRLQRLAVLALAAASGTVGAYLTPTPNAAERAMLRTNGRAPTTTIAQRR
jgi:hypothetical protein